MSTNPAAVPSPEAIANIGFQSGAHVTNMTVTNSTFTGQNGRAHFFQYGNGATTNLQVIDNEFTDGRFVWEDSGGSDARHTGLTFQGNLFEGMRSHVLDFTDAKYTGVSVVDNDFRNIYNGGTATIWLGLSAGTHHGEGGDNVIAQNRFIQEPAFLDANPAGANKWAVLNDARAANADEHTGWSITENHIEGYHGTTDAPIANIDYGRTTVWGNTFGPGTRGSLDRAETETGRSWFVWNADGNANHKIQTWRVTDTQYAGQSVTVTAESVEPLPGNNAETQPVEIHAYWTASDQAEVYLGKFPGTYSGTATHTFTDVDPARLPDGAVFADGTVRVQIIDADGNSSQYSGEGDAIPALPAFTCEAGTVFVSQNDPTQLFTAVQGTNGITFEAEGPASQYRYNALGFRESDGYLYAIRGNNNVIRIGQGGVIEDLGATTPALPGSSYHIGTFGAGADADKYYVTHWGVEDRLWVIDIDTMTQSALDLSGTLPNTSDIVYVDGFLWAFRHANEAYRIDPSTGELTEFNTGLNLPGDQPNFGAQWAYGNGDIGLSENSSGQVHRIQITDPASDAPVFTKVFTTSGPSTSNNDGAACIGEPTDLSLTKSGPETYEAGQEISYTITVTNEGPGASSGSVVTDTLPEGLTDVTTPTEGCEIVDGVLTCITGPLAAGDEHEITVTATAPATAAGDLVNTATVTGNEADPEPDNNEGSTTAKSSTPLIGVLDDWKTVSPATGSTLQPGETATYTLHFTNTGNAPVTVDRDDVLTDVLDDADLTGQPVASSDALTVSDIADGRLSVTGELAPGEVATVTYQVTVREDGARGDDRLGNFLVPTGEEPPASCAPTDSERPDCTVNHVSDVAVAKSSDPASGSEVDPGEKITYTVTFTNRSTNEDAAPVIVDYTDHMADVLDDATLTAGPTVSHENLTATVEDDTIRITGTVPTGAKYTVTYTVTVNSYDKQGDGALSNIVAITGEEPVCVEGSPLCTMHEGSEPPAPVNRDDPDGSLPITGGEISTAVIIAALLLLGAGGGIVLLSRRPKAATQGTDQEVSIDELI